MSAVKHATDNFEAVRGRRETLPWGKIGIYLAVAAVIFLAGLVPMWLKASEAASQRDAAQRELRLNRMESGLASAVIDARRGEYEVARQTASDFFTALRKNVDDAPAETQLSQTQRNGLSELLAERDQVITLLARSDPAAADRLSDMYVSYRQTMSSAGPPADN